MRTADTVVFEAVYALEKLYRVPRDDIRRELLALLALPGIVLPGKRAHRRVFDLYVSQSRLSFAGCYHAVLADRLGLTEMLSFDQGFDRVPWLTGEEP